MKSCSRWAAVLAVLAAFMFAGCEVDKATQPWPDAEKVSDPGVSTIPMATGYYKGRVVEYWDAGTATTAVSNVYVLYRSGSNSPIPFDQQFPIIAAVPDSAGYSPFRHVYKVIVPRSYVANTLTSVADLENALYLVQATPTYTAWDAPSVNEQATLGGTTQQPMPVWYGGRIAYVFKFENNDVLVNRTTGQVPASEILEVERAGERLAGNTIFSAKKGDQGFSPLRRESRVAVTEAYPLTGTAPWQSFVAAELNFDGYFIEKIETETLVNHPIKNVGGYTLFDEDLGHVDDSDPALYPAGEMTERLAWSGGSRRSYFDLGRDSGYATDFWILYRTGSDTPIEEQRVIANSVPGDTLYGAARRVHRVYLDSSAPYTSNSIKSYQTLLQLGATEELRTVWNAPAVQTDARAGTQVPVVGWARGHSFHYFVFEQDIQLADGGIGIPVMATYEVYRERFDGDPDPEWLDYNSLMTSAPGGDDYSPFRDITQYIVSPAYPDTAWRSTSDAVNNAGGYRTGTAAVQGVFNRPVRD